VLARTLAEPPIYRKSYAENELPENNHLIAVVIFKTQVDESGNYVPNNFVTTGWAKYIQRGEANE
jgi:hypothetical protein